MGSSLAIGLTVHANAEELRIGFLAPTTGIFAQIGKDMVDGFKMYLDEHNNKLGGADVKFIVEDEQGKPDTAVTKAKKLVLQDKVHMFVGGLLASTGYALAPVSTAEKSHVHLVDRLPADDLTQRDLPKYPYFIRTSWTSSQPSHPFGQWACDQGYKTMAAIGADYAFGYEVVGGFQRAFEACGGKIVQKIWLPLGAKDFGPYIPTLKTGRRRDFLADGRPAALQFPKQLARLGQQQGADRRRRQLRRIRAAVDGRRGDRPRLGAAIQRGARHAEERGLREGLPRQVRQGAVLLLGEQLHDRADDRRGDRRRTTASTRARRSSSSSFRR